MKRLAIEMLVRRGNCPNQPEWFDNILLELFGKFDRMLAKYSIHADARTSILSITISGFFEPPDIVRFVAAVRVELCKLRCEPNRHITLVDMRDMKIQPQGSVDGFQRALNDPELMSRRIAFVVEPGLARAQVQRAASGRPAQYFSSLDLARNWLTSDDTATAGRRTFLPPIKAPMRASLA